MDHLKRGLIVLPLCWALTTALPADEMSVLDRSAGTTIELVAGDQSVATTIELAAGDQSVGTTIGLAVRAVFQTAPLAAQNGNGNGNGGGECENCYEETEVTCGDVQQSPQLFDTSVRSYCYGKDPEYVIPSTLHYFPHIGWGCHGSTSHPSCRRCDPSDCHLPWKFGPCYLNHSACGGGGGSDPDFAALIADIQLALQGQDASHLAGVFLTARELAQSEIKDSRLHLSTECGGSLQVLVPPGAMLMVRNALRFAEEAAGPAPIAMSGPAASAVSGTD
jgi:hypothetical protein